MGDEEVATLDGQFIDFAKFMDTEKKRDGTIINLYRQDYWMRQAKVLDDRKLTMTDTGRIWFRWGKTELNWDEWCEFLVMVCNEKNIEQEIAEIMLTNCGAAGTVTVVVPQYRDFFDNFKPKSKLML